MLTGHFLCDQEDASQPAFAARVLGSAHVLDDGTPQANVTLAGIRALTGFPDGTGAEWRQTAPVAFEQEPLRAHPALDAERGGFYYPDSDRNLQKEMNRMASLDRYAELNRGVGTKQRLTSAPAGSSHATRAPYCRTRRK
ncbi:MULTISPECIES: TIGR02679 domain-containing protein [unclassified Streptomyces]|uniref:TIGR02679 domain-containing protein n=1 Tax=unclassified Streptomyces TaxID=2593676 RepID=UPI0032537BDC